MEKKWKSLFCGRGCEIRYVCTVHFTTPTGAALHALGAQLGPRAAARTKQVWRAAHRRLGRCSSGRAASRAIRRSARATGSGPASRINSSGDAGGSGGSRGWGSPRPGGGGVSAHPSIRPPGRVSARRMGVYFLFRVPLHFSVSCAFPVVYLLHLRTFCHVSFPPLSAFLVVV